MGSPNISIRPRMRRSTLQSPTHFHYPHFGYVLEGGTLSITDDAGAVEVRQTITGKSWSTNKITIHEAMNIGDTTTTYLIIESKLN